jgi:hypothetical protein
MSTRPHPRPPLRPSPSLPLSSDRLTREALAHVRVDGAVALGRAEGEHVVVVRLRGCAGEERRCSGGVSRLLGGAHTKWPAAFRKTPRALGLFGVPSVRRVLGPHGRTRRPRGPRARCRIEDLRLFTGPAWLATTLMPSPLLKAATMDTHDAATAAAATSDANPRAILIDALTRQDAPEAQGPTRRLARGSGSGPRAPELRGTGRRLGAASFGLRLLPSRALEERLGSGVPHGSAQTGLEGICERVAGDAMGRRCARTRSVEENAILTPNGRDERAVHTAPRLERPRPPLAFPSLHKPQVHGIPPASPNDPRGAR